MADQNADPIVIRHYQADAPGCGWNIVGAVVGAVFIILKWTHAISWSWLWVLSPFWISLAVYIAIILSFFVRVLIKESTKW